VLQHRADQAGAPLAAAARHLLEELTPHTDNPNDR